MLTAPDFVHIEPKPDRHRRVPEGQLQRHVSDRLVKVLSPQWTQCSGGEQGP